VNIGIVRIISHRAIREFTANHKAAAQPLDDWYRIAKRAAWSNLAEVRMIYPHADLVGSCVVFNVGGNKWRLISKIAFNRHVLYIRFILTHKDYDEGGWKHDCGA
jgi:mRNA interferase HigB